MPEHDRVRQRYLEVVAQIDHMRELLDIAWQARAEGEPLDRQIDGVEGAAAWLEQVKGACTDLVEALQGSSKELQDNQSCE